MLLNIDLGELPGEPDELYALASVANVACGGHAGDEASMARALGLALARGTLVAAHPSYPDRAGFGRVSMAIDPAALRASVAAQCAALRQIAAASGAQISMLKPHGALYHDAARDEATAQAVVDGALEGLGLPPAELSLVGPPAGALLERARAAGARYLREGFADRGYAPGGGLLPRGTTGALLAEPAAAAAQALALARSGSVDTICVHGDTPGAVPIARAVRLALDGLPAALLPP
jgi:5-oxoprolinase (ATP-hydrolysing) subunit A